MKENWEISYAVQSTFAGDDAADLPVQLYGQPNTALFSLALCLTTYTLAVYLKGIKDTKILVRQVGRQ